MWKETSDRVETDLAQLREKRGFSAATLAGMINVTRQTIYAIEAGNYVPNTAVALRLARALDVGVEALFKLPDASSSCPPAKAEHATCLPDCAALQTDQPVQLCRVDRRLVATRPETDPWVLPASDALVVGKSTVQAYQSGGDFRNRILLAGCDPAVSILARHLLPAGIELVFVPRNSSQSLKLLRERCIHIAGTHLRDEMTGESNIPEIQKFFEKGSIALVSFAVWEEGFLIARTNPKQIKRIEDLTRRGVSMVNRESGSGSRRLLDQHLKQSNLSSNRIRGYDRLATGHFSAARQVANGTVDCCIANRATARAFGLDFIPLVTERYDLAIRTQHLKTPAVETVLDVLNRAAFRRELEGTGGYETRVSGQRLM